jgi:hypothetical protein
MTFPGAYSSYRKEGKTQKKMWWARNTGKGENLFIGAVKPVNSYGR